MEPTPDIVRIGAVRLRDVRFRDEQSKVPVPFEGPIVDLVGAQHATRVEKKGTRIWRGLRLRRDGEPAGGGWRIDGASSGYSPRVTASVDVAQATTGVGADRPKYPEDAPPSAIRHPEPQPAEGWEEGEL